MASNYKTSDGIDLDSRYLGIKAKAESAKYSDSAGSANTASRASNADYATRAGSADGATLTVVTLGFADKKIKAPSSGSKWVCVGTYNYHKSGNSDTGDSHYEGSVHGLYNKGETVVGLSYDAYPDSSEIIAIKVS